MAILIDGYNLLHVSGILRRGIGPGTLQRARQALLNHIATQLTDDPQSVTVVFDAKDCPRDLPQALEYRGIQVQFARDFEEADDLLEYLIRVDSAPRQLTVVSSDRRVQRAAKRRRACVRDSEQWLRELQAPVAEPANSPELGKPEPSLTAGQISDWLEAFGFAPPLAAGPDEESTAEGSFFAVEAGEPDSPVFKAPSRTAPGESTAGVTPDSADRSGGPPALNDEPDSQPQPPKKAGTKSQPKPPVPAKAKPRQLPEGEDASPFPADYLDELSNLEDLM